MKTKLIILLVGVFLLNISFVQAQRERNYIYLFDCTQSMKGFGGAPDIWEQTKKYLLNDLERMDNYSTVHIVPFQKKAHPVISFKGKEYNWGSIDNVLDKYIEDITPTGICNAWDKGIPLFDPHKDNYLILLTDGEENVLTIDDLCQRIRDWCGRFENSYGIYVMLTSKAQNPKITKAIESCPSLFWGTPEDHFSPFIIKQNNEIVVNRLQLDKIHPISFSALGDFSISVESTDPLFNIEFIESKIKDGKAQARVVSRKDLTEITSALQGKAEYEFTVTLNVENAKLINDMLHIRVINDPERLLEMPTDGQLKVVEANYYPRFLFASESKRDTLRIRIPTLFNQDAKQYRSSVAWQINDKEGNNDFELLVDGTPMSDRKFTTTADTDEIEVGIIFHPEAVTGKRILKLTPINAERLERINAATPKDYTLSLDAVYNVGMNPLKKALIVIGILILALLIVWFLMLKRIIYPTFKVGSITISDPYFSTRQINKCHKLVCTRKAMKQSWINRLFTGKVVYEINDYWITDLVFLPKDQNSVKLQGSREYYIDPYAVNLTRYQEYKITNQTTGEKLELQIN
ncbi:hypothetical protein LJC39_00270 [Parabacteroides sp. OttesenSCG-928-B22]|nr:hypothetical protein [Parabacteroides sp. OttesenSCG-928-B22]